MRGPSLARLVALGLFTVAGCRGEHKSHPPDAPAPASVRPIHLEPRMHLLPTYPCSSCHAGRAPQPKRHTLDVFHRTRYDEFQHGEDEFWCYQCHALENIDKLKMANGNLVSFDEAPQLCTSCHGDKLHDYNAGIHGLQAGEWAGEKFRRPCTSCHNPHNPRFEPIVPEKAPAPPRSIL